MQRQSVTYTRSGMSKICFLLSLLLLTFWCLVHITDVYRFAFAGAIFELLWLPMLVLSFVLPVVSLVFLIKEKLGVRSFYLYALLVSMTNIFLMIYTK